MISNGSETDFEMARNSSDSLGLNYNPKLSPELYLHNRSSLEEMINCSAHKFCDRCPSNCINPCAWDKSNKMKNCNSFITIRFCSMINFIKSEMILPCAELSKIELIDQIPKIVP